MEGMVGVARETHAAVYQAVLASVCAQDAWRLPLPTREKRSRTHKYSEYLDIHTIALPPGLKNRYELGR